MMLSGWRLARLLAHRSCIPVLSPVYTRLNYNTWQEEVSLEVQGLQEDIGKEENAVQAGLVSQVETTEAQVGQFLSQQDAEEIAARMDARFERLQLLCQGTDLRMMEAVAKVALAARMLPDARVTGPVPLRKQRTLYTILSGPFKHKKHRDQLEQLRYKRIITIETSRSTATKFLQFLRENMPPVIAINVRRTEYIPIEEMYSFPKHVEKRTSPAQ